MVGEMPESISRQIREQWSKGKSQIVHPILCDILFLGNPDVFHILSNLTRYENGDDSHEIPLEKIVTQIEFPLWGLFRKSGKCSKTVFKPCFCFEKVLLVGFLQIFLKYSSTV